MKLRFVGFSPMLKTSQPRVFIIRVKLQNPIFGNMYIALYMRYKRKVP